MRRAVAACLALLLVFAAAGCWSRKEINELAIIVALGIDYEPGDQPYRITHQIARVSALVRGAASQGTPAGPPVEVVTGTGRTPHEAARDLQRGMPRRFHPQHLEVIIIGEEMARRGIAPLVDFFERIHLLRPNMLVLIARGKAREVVNAGANLERTLAEQVTGLVRFRTYSISAMKVNVQDLALVLSRPGWEPVITGIQINPEAVDVGQPMVMLQDLAVFKGDRLVAWLPPESNLGFLWVRNQISHGLLTVPCPGEPDKFLTMRVDRGHTTRRPGFIGGRPVVYTQTRLESDLTTQDCRQDLSTPEGFAKLSAAQEAHVRSVIEAAVTEFQTLKTDGLGFGELFRRHYPAFWRRVRDRWDEEILPTVEIQVSVEVDTRRPGLISRPAAHDSTRGGR